MAYGPYVREMNLWFKHANQVTIIAPLDKLSKSDAIEINYEHMNIRFIAVPEFHLKTTSSIIKSIFTVPYIMLVIWWQIWGASHIHLRCPGNMGLLGCIVQVLFPWKKKTAKYAGNWDWKSKQPLSYRLQQIILRSTILTKNMQALVYGVWADRTINILPFFTASYSESDKIPVPNKSMNDAVIRFIYVGTLTLNKQPLLALDIFSTLMECGKYLEMHFYGDGPLKNVLIKRINELGLITKVIIHGNVDSEKLKLAYQQSHFLLSYSKSEGWPKAVSEAMWWGCVPITTSVSCVRWMLNEGANGFIINKPLQTKSEIYNCFTNPEVYTKMKSKAMDWSRNYTIEYFDKSIKHLI